MKRLIFIILIFSVSSMFTGCQKDNLRIESDQNNQETNSLKAAKTPFTGTCSFFAPGYGGDTTFLPNGNMKIKGQTATWFDDASDYRVTGLSDWTVNWLVTGMFTAKVWGKTELLVGTDPENPDVDPIGVWKLSWHGVQTPTENGFKIVCYATGTGKEGVVKGLVAKWTYTMDADFANLASFIYITEGYIFE